MDQITTTTTTTTTKTSENGNPPKSQPNKSLTFSNGALKKHHHHLHYLTPGLPPPPPAAAVVVVAYKECLKNHAASMGGHAVDGCGEFMPSPTATPTDPTSLKCAACGCHRNFHRREPDDYPKTTLTTTHFLDFRNHPTHSPTRGASASASPSPSPPPQPLPPLHYSSAPHMLLALSTALPDDPPAMNHHHPVLTPTAAKAENPSGRKRFRTKFSRDQKEKMFSFSEKLSWKLQKCDEGLIEEFCNEVGIGKSVLKVWMHNNKHTFGKRDSNITTTNNNSNGQNTNNNGHYHNESSGVHLNLSTDGSSSSS